jgi:transposase
MSPSPLIPEKLWQQVSPAMQAAIGLLMQHYEQQIATLQQRVAELEQRLDQNSTNSSRPPSSDGPTVKRRPPEPPSGRPRGGQPSHLKQQRPLLPPDQIIPCKPNACACCGHALHGDDPQPHRHQVLELPPIRPEVTEYQLHRLCCPQCGHRTSGRLPDGVPSGCQGPRLQSTVGLLTGNYRLSKRKAAEFCQDLLGVPLCAGEVCTLERRLSAAMEPVVAELRLYVRSQNANMDETTWWLGNRRAYLWVVVTAQVTIFHVDPSRAGTVAQGLIDVDAGTILTTDRYKAYLFWPVERRQLCWAHLRRDFQAMIDRGNAGTNIGENLLFLSDLMFDTWHRVRDGTLQRKTLRYRVEQWYRPDVRQLLEAGSRCGCTKTEGTCRDLLALEPAMWTFARVEGVEPTNNAAEQLQRHPAQWRKTSYGSDSVAGGRFVANILTMVATCRQQGKKVLDVLTACSQAVFSGGLSPSLLPHTTS